MYPLLQRYFGVDKHGDKLGFEGRYVVHQVPGRQVRKNKRIDEDTIIDLDTKGRLLGIEMLNVTKKVPTSSWARAYFFYLPKKL